MAIYDMASAIQQPNIAGAYQQGVQFRNALADLAAKRAEEQRQIEIRNGLAQFYRQAQPEQRTMQPQGMSLLDMASIGAAGPGTVPNSPMMADRMPNAQWRGMASPSPIPAVAEKVTPAVPGGFDYQGAADFLARNGEFQQAGALAQLRKFTDPESAKFGLNPQVGINPQTGKPEFFVTNEQGMPRFLGVQDQPKAIEAPKVRTLKVGGREVSQEWNGSQWVTVAEAPRDLPEPVKPTLIQTDAGYEWVKPGQAPQGKPKPAGGSEPTEGERKAAAAGLVMNNAEANFFAANNGTGMSAKGYYASQLPGGGYLVGKQDQKAKQAMADWYREKLRLESGATIGDSEAYEEAKRYFPVPGDKQETIEQKAAARKVVMEGLRLKAGRAAGAAAPERRELPPTNAKGWKLMIDANGNRAYVGPNNEIEEVR